MKLASISVTKNQLSMLIDQVRNGEVIVITDRERPVAQLTAVTQDVLGAGPGGFEALERKGILRCGSGSAGPLEAPQRMAARASAVAALLEERDAAR